MDWYYANGDRRQGPISQSEFEQLIRQGTIHGQTLVWRSGLANWIAFADVQPTLPPLLDPNTGAGTPTEPETAICAVSGKRYPKREMIQYEGKWVAAEHRDAFFQRLSEGIVEPGTMVYGGFWIRFVAKFLDGIILAVANALVNLLIGAGMFAQNRINPGDPAQLRHFLALQGLAMVISISMGLLYSWFFLSRYQATPGKMALNLKVVRSDGSGLSTGRIIGRYFAEMVSALTLYIGYIMAGIDESQHRALHDRICDTRVIKTK